MPRRSILLFAGACIAIAVALAIITVVVVSGRAPTSDGAEVTSTGQPLVGGDFKLVNQDGRPVDQTMLNGKWSLVFFGFTYCPEFCPTTLAELAAVKQRLGDKADDLQIVFVSVDPERDTPQVLQAYMANFDPSFVALRGTPEQVAATAKDFKVYYKKVEGKTPGTYTMDHSAASFVYDPQGRLRLYTRYGTGAQALADDLKLLLKEA